MPKRITKDGHEIHEELPACNDLECLVVQTSLIGLNELANECHENSVVHGFWDIESENGNGEVVRTYSVNARDMGEITANIHGEVSEMWEDYRDHRGMTEIYYEHKGFKPDFNPFDHSNLSTNEGYKCSCGSGQWPCPVSVANIVRKPCGIPIEAADIIIRVLDMCAAYGIDIEAAIAMKMEYNSTRPYMHGKKV